MTRVFIPTTEFVGQTGVRRSVKRWTWTPSRGLRVEFADGLVCKSDWKSLPAFLLAVKEGREGPVREVLS